MTRIAIIGAGGYEFPLQLMNDFLSYASTKDATYALMDIDPESLRRTERLSRRLVDAHGLPHAGAHLALGPLRTLLRSRERQHRDDRLARRELLTDHVGHRGAVGLLERRHRVGRQAAAREARAATRSDVRGLVDLVEELLDLRRAEPSVAAERTDGRNLASARP